MMGQSFNQEQCSALLPQLHGVLVLNKPSGLSSNRCLMQIKRMGQKKIGHAGTLDPMAEGVLLVLLGQATKLSSYLLENGGKVYCGTLRLGQVSDTWDSQGTILSEHDTSHITCDDVSREIAAWQDLHIQQVPPFSAAKLDGKPLYKLARQGTMIERTKQIQIEQAVLLEAQLPFVRFRVHCRSGTYIRSLAHSLGMRLGCGAVLTELTREYSHPFGLDGALSLSDLASNPAQLVRYLRPIRDALPSWPCIVVPKAWVNAVRSGQSVPVASLSDVEKAERAILTDGECELALVSRESGEHGDVWKVLRGLWNSE